MNDVLEIDATGTEAYRSAACAYDALLGLFTVPARALASAIAHPRADDLETIVVQDDLRGRDEEYSLVELAMATDRDMVCVLGDSDADGTGDLLAVQVDDEGAWIGYCRAFSSDPAAPALLVPVDARHDLHLAMGADGRLHRLPGRPATHPAFGFRMGATRVLAAAEAIREDEEEEARAA